MSIATQIRDGLMASQNPKVVEIAKRFMDDNGFQLTSQGKGVACSEVDNWAERNDVGIEISLAVKTAIMQL